MNADELCQWLRSGHQSQRDKATALHKHYLAVVRELYDDDYAQVMREIKKRLNSPKLAAEITELLAVLADHPANPRPRPGDPPKPAVEPPPVAVDDHPAQLEAAIAADPETRDNYIVYGDWLETQGDPRGQLVTIGQELAKNPNHKAMLAAHITHLKAHGEAILGSLAGCEDLVTEVEWHMGFMRKARVAYTMDRFNNSPTRPRVTIPDVVSWLLDEPGPGRFLQHLTLGMILHDDNRYEQTIAVIARKRRSLRSLYVGDFSSDECELNWTSLGELRKLWPMVPQLRELTLRGGSMVIGPIYLPKLERLTTVTGGLDGESLAYVAAADWPELRRLSLQIGRDCSAARLLEPLLAGTHLPKLEALGIVNCQFVDELLHMLVDSPLLPRIKSLDVSMGTMSMDGVAVLEANADKFRHLDAIDVNDNYLPDEARQLQSMFPNLYFGAQRDDEGDPGNRYASAIE